MGNDRELLVKLDQTYGFRLDAEFIDSPCNSTSRVNSCFHRADIALIGLAVMGQNLIMNMNDHGFVVRP